MSSGRRLLNQSLSSSANKLKLDSLNKILKIDRSRSKKSKRESLSRQVSRVVLSELLHKTAESKQDIPDFRVFLSKEENIKIFREFLKTQYCQENIDFYLACEKYRQLDPERVGNELVKFMATQIFNDHLSENARHRVNINYDCLQNIVKQIKDPKPNMLYEAQAEIFNLMRTDCYPRFCKTWRIDRETANKILREKPVDSTPNTRSYLSTNNITNTSLCTNTTFTSLNTSIRSSNSRGIKRKAEMVNGSTVECPPECPYFRVGLPCQQHNLDQDNLVEQKGKSDLIDKINLSRIHHVPNCCVRRTPPPPPLPPKPRQVKISPTINKKFCPYVSQAFDV